MLSGLTEVEMFSDRSKDLQTKIFKLSHGEIIYAERILSRYDIAIPTPAKIGASERVTHFSRYFFGRDRGESQTRSDAAGPRAIVPSGVVSVRV